MTDNKQEGLALSKDEIALYDRQIRLWGINAQQRMRNSKVLLYNLGGCGTEITKNLVLSGIGSLTIYDSHLLSEDDFFNQFFISNDDPIGVSRVVSAKPRIQDMNPRVNVECHHETDLLENLDVIKNFDIVIVTECNNYEKLVAINEMTRTHNIPFYLCGGNGLYGYCFIDLIEFIATDEKLKTSTASTKLSKLSSNREIVEVVERVDEDDETKVYEIVKTKNIYKSFSDFLNFNPSLLPNQLTKRQLRKLTVGLPLTLANFKVAADKDITQDYIKTVTEQVGLLLEDSTLSPEMLSEFNRQKNIEFPPVNAIVGGAVAQDVINILGKQESPLNNILVFDGNTLEMPILEL